MSDVLVPLVILNLVVGSVTLVGLFNLWRFLEQEMPRRRRKAKRKDGV